MTWHACLQQVTPLGLVQATLALRKQRRSADANMGLHCLQFHIEIRVCIAVALVRVSVWGGDSFWVFCCFFFGLCFFFGFLNPEP